MKSNMKSAKIAECPFCDSGDVVTCDEAASIGERAGWFVTCQGCKAQGPVKDSEDRAIAAWGDPATEMRLLQDEIDQLYERG